MNNDNLLVQVAQQCAIEPAELQEVLMKTVMPNNSKPENVTAFLAVAKQHNLNPLTREIYAFPAKSGGISVVMSVDGWNKIMNQHPQFDGIEFNHSTDEKGQVVSVTATIYRKDRQRPTVVTEFLSECNTGSQPWKQYPSRMLRHAAMKQAIRLAFGLSGVAPEPEAAEEEEPPAPKVINPEGSQTFFLLKEQFESCQSQEALEEANSLANAYAKRGDLKKGEVDRLKLIQKQVEQDIAATMATATEAA
jgi:phage recombination protein Bet